MPGDKIPSYMTMHNRVRRVRGHPSLYPCTGGCGQPGQQWAYLHDDLLEVVDDKGHHYSLFVESYAPMCVWCHTRFDHPPGTGRWKRRKTQVTRQ